MQNWNQGQYQAARIAMRDSIRWQILMFLLVEVVGVLFSRPLTGMILGPGNNAPISLLPLLMLGGFLWQLALLAHKPLEVMHRTRTMLVGMIIVLLIELVGNYLFVPRFGLEAAVYVFVFGAAAYLGFVVLFNPLAGRATASLVA
jgi:O-antigen/teichoic acid export membrane protein